MSIGSIQVGKPPDKDIADDRRQTALSANVLDRNCGPRSCSIDSTLSTTPALVGATPLGAVRAGTPSQSTKDPRMSHR